MGRFPQVSGLTRGEGDASVRHQGVLREMKAHEPAQELLWFLLFLDVL